MAMAAIRLRRVHGTWSREKSIREARAARPDAAGDVRAVLSARLDARQHGVNGRTKGGRPGVLGSDDPSAAKTGRAVVDRFGSGTIAHDNGWTTGPSGARDGF